MMARRGLECTSYFVAFPFCDDVYSIVSQTHLPHHIPGAVVLCSLSELHSRRGFAVYNVYCMQSGAKDCKMAD
jgi:hypothetical protein